MNMFSRYSKKHLLFALCSVLVLCTLAACGSNSTTTTNTQPQTAQTPQGNSNSKGGNTTQQQTSTPTTQTTTVTMPATQTSCPAMGTARAFVSAPLALGHHQNLVYIVNQSQHNNPTFATLKHYDTTTGSKTVIVQLQNTSISSAQISANGQWVLFVSGNGTQEKLQAVRMDGEGLQTLYCGNFQTSPQWSTNQRLIAFEQVISGNLNIYLLHTATGALEDVFTQPNANVRVYLLRTWLDNSHMYLVRTTTDANPDVLALLDITKGDNQTASSLTQIVPSSQDTISLGSFDSSYDGTHLFVNHNSCGYGCTGPSDITVQPAQGGQEQTIYRSQQYAVTNVRAVTANILLVDINNQPFMNNHVDQSHNGLWTMHTDGSNLTRLTTDTATTTSSLNAYSQLPWSNVSRDGSTYSALLITSAANQQPTYAIITGSLTGGTSNTIASISDGTTLDIAGWTTM